MLDNSGIVFRLKYLSIIQLNFEILHYVYTNITKLIDKILSEIEI